MLPDIPVTTNDPTDIQAALDKLTKQMADVIIEHVPAEDLRNAAKAWVFTAIQEMRNSAYWRSKVPEGITPKPTWEELYKEAEFAVERAHLAIDDISGWSGSAGNWPLQEASTRIREALQAIRKPEPPR